MKFEFVKDFVKSPSEKIPMGSELTYYNQGLYINNIMITPAYYNFFIKMINDEIAKPNYLKKVE